MGFIGQGFNFGNFTSGNGCNVDWDTFTGDDFTGLDATQPDACLWTTGGGTIINSNKLRCPVSSTTTFSHAQSLFDLTGDFDIQVDFDIALGPSTAGWYAAFSAVDDTADNEVRIVYGYHSSDSRWRGFYRDNGGSLIGIGTQIPETTTSSKFRMVRNGIGTSIQRWNGSGWTAYAANTQGINNEDCKIRVFALSYTSEPTVTVDFDNFTITSGTVIGP